MKHFFSLPLALLSALLSAFARDIEVIPGGNTVYLSFPEAVVRGEAVSQKAPKKPGPETAMVELSGEAAYAPAMRWGNSRTLCLEAREGTPAGCTYRVRLKEGTTYLSGAPATQEEAQAVFLPGYVSAYFGVQLPQGCAVVVGSSAESSAVRLTPDCRLQFSFIEQVESRGLFGATGHREGRTVSAHLEQARLCHGMDASLLRAILPQISPEKMREDSPLPGCVLVVPDEPLPDNSRWLLRYTSAEAGVTRNVGILNNLQGLRTQLSCEGTDASGATEWCLSFSSPLRRAEAEQLFRRLVLRAGGANAAPQEALTAEAGAAALQGGKLTRSIALPGNAVQWTYLGRAEQKEPPTVYQAGDKGDWAYDNQELCRAVRLRVESQSPCTLELVLPKGCAVSSLGVGVEEDIIHRLSQGAVAPYADVCRYGRGVRLLSLPRRGGHRVLVTTGACRSLQVSAHYWSPAEMVEQRADLGELMSSYCPGDDSYEYALGTARYRAGLAEEKPEHEGRSQRRRYERCRKRVLRSGHALGDRVFPAPAGARTASAEWPLALDEWAADGVAPGLYLLHLRAEAEPAALAAAEALGVQANAVAEERDIWVQVTDLSLLSSPAAVTLHHRESGCLPGQATLYLSDDRRTLAMENGFADPRLLPEPGKEAWYVAQEGDDACMAPCSISYADFSDNSDADTLHRGKMLSDRSHYRPGEEVHLFGMVRRVRGDDSRPQRDKLLLTVRKPDGSSLLQESVRPDAYGTFEARFTLPEDEENVAGTYTCVLTPGPYSYTLPYAEKEVQCEVFRRDSFEIEFESDLPKIAPQHYSCSLLARDYNGTPLAGAKVELQLLTDGTMPGAKEEDGCRVLQATFRTDAEGRARFSTPISMPRRSSDEAADVLNICAKAAVTNDRGEVKLAEVTAQAYTADFRVLRKGNSLCAFRRPQKEGDAENRLLDRPQHLHLVLRGEKENAQPLRNGFVRLTQTDTALWSGDITIPARAEGGVPLPLDEAMLKKLPSYLSLEISGRDAAGRLYRRSENLTARDLREYAEHSHFSKGGLPEAPNFDLLTLEHKDGTCFSVDAAEGGEVCVVMQSRKGLQTARRRLLPGKQELNLPELAGTTGRVNVFLLHPTRSGGALFEVMDTARSECFIPDDARTLDVAVELPAHAALPGAILPLRGRVTRRTDGRPADARVLLFAVDKGMLSVAGKKVTLPDWEEHFTGPLSKYPIPSALTLPRRFAPSREASPLAGLWQGECCLQGEWKQPMAGCSLESAPGSGDDGWWNLFSVCGQQQQAPVMPAAPYSLDSGSPKCAPAPVCPVVADSELPPWIISSMESKAGSGSAALRLREDFRPLAIWSAELETDADGVFETQCRMPDTLTTYTFFCVAADASGSRFGNFSGDVEVSQPVMLTPGAPLFMSTGDRLQLPLTVTNGTDKEDTWKITYSEGGEKSLRLAAKSTSTLFFEAAPKEEGKCELWWCALADSGRDSVQVRFPVRYPAPLLKETHRAVLGPEDGAVSELRPAALLSPAVASSVRGELRAELSANPLLHFSGCAEALLEYPYACTEQTASALLPWLLYARLAPVCPALAEMEPKEAAERVQEGIDNLFERQLSDGGLSYWKGGRRSCFWASAHAALVLSYAREQGADVPRRALRRLKEYLEKERRRLVKEGLYHAHSPLLRFEVARVLGEKNAMRVALAEVAAEAQSAAAVSSEADPGCTPSIREDVQFLQALHGERREHHPAFLRWMRSHARDERHDSTWSSAWTLIALQEYLAGQPKSDAVSRIVTVDGKTLELGQGITTVPLAGKGQKLSSVPECFRAVEGQSFIAVRAKAQPRQTQFAGSSSMGLKLTRRYEKQAADGSWHAATSFRVGDVVRVTLSCTKNDPTLHYFVLEDYLPSCMEAINPNVPSQAAGIDFAPWSESFDHREYLADRVRGFCSDWAAKKPLTMVYYARVKRAGTATAPPAQAQLMYEPQVRALSPTATFTTSGE